MTRNEQQMYSDITSIRESLEKIAKALNNNATQTTKDIPGFEGVLNDLDNLYQPTSSNPDPAGYENEEIGDDVHNDFLNDLVQDMNHTEYLNFHHDMAFGFASSDAVALTNHIYDLEYEECLDAIKRALLITGDSDYINAVASTGGIASDVAGRKYVEELLEKENTTQPTNDPYTYDNDLNEYVNGIKNDSDHDIRSTAKYYEEIINDTLDMNINTKKDAILDYEFKYQSE